MNTKNISFTNRVVIMILGGVTLLMSFFSAFKLSYEYYGINMISIPVGALKMVSGISLEGYTIMEPQYIFILPILIPIAIIAVAAIKDIQESLSSKIILGLSIADILFWLITVFYLFYKVAEAGASDYIKIGLTFWFFVALIALGFIVFICIRLIQHKAIMESMFAFNTNGTGYQPVIPNSVKTTVSSTVNNVIAGINQASTIGYCQNCGKPLHKGYVFCKECGTKVPDEILKTAEATTQPVSPTPVAPQPTVTPSQPVVQQPTPVEEKPQETVATPVVEQPTPVKKVCKNCGAELEDDDMFCQSCGTKVE